MATKAAGTSWTARAAMVARWFGVGREAVELAGRRTAAAALPRVPLRGGRVVLLTGASGAGKSTLLRRLRKRSARRATWVELDDCGAGVLPAASSGGARFQPASAAWKGCTTMGGSRDGWATEDLVIDVMTDAMGGGDDEASVVAALEALSRVGLGEVWTYLRTPGQLSEGQRWRLRLALGLARARPGAGRGLCVLAVDEFGAPLDRVTALVVARALRKAVSARPDLCAVVATSHDDLVGALAPDVVVRCDFGGFEVREGGRS